VIRLVMMRLFTSVQVQRIGRACLVYARMYLINLRRRSPTEVKTPRAITSRSILANHSSSWFNQDE